MTTKLCLLTQVGRWPLIGLAVTLISTFTAMVQAQPAAPGQDAAFVRPFVSESTFAVVKLDLARMAPEEGPGAASPQAVIAALTDNQPIYATVGIPVSEKRIPLFFFVKKPSAEQAAQIEKMLKSRIGLQLTMQDQYVVATTNDQSSTPASFAPASERTQKSVADAFASVADYPLQLLLIPPEYVWRTMRELSPNLPSQLGGGPSRVLTDGVVWAALGFDPRQAQLVAVIQSTSPQAANDFAAQLPVMLRSLYNAVPAMHEYMPPQTVLAMIASLKPTVEDSRVTIRVEGPEEFRQELAQLVNFSRSLELRIRRGSEEDRLKRIMLALHNYHDTHRSFPPIEKDRDPQGKPRLSWRVHILPYVGEADLYRQFRLDERWDSPHNKTLLEKMPSVYLNAAIQGVAPGHTTTLAPVGENTIFGQEKASTIAHIRDGTSNTVAIIEVTAEQAVPWTAPEDYAFDPKQPLAGAWPVSDGYWLSGFADGSIRRLRSNAAPATILLLFQMSDGQPVDANALR